MQIPNRIIAITGDIASGKTTRCKELIDSGHAVIFQDKLVRQIWETYYMKCWLGGEQQRQSSYMSIMDYKTPEQRDADREYNKYLPDVYCSSSNEINYPKLREWVFSDPSVLQDVKHQMENIFPGMFYKEYIRLGLNLPCAEMSDGYMGTPVEPTYKWEDVYYESATIFADGLQKKFDEVEHLSAPADIRLKRVMERDNCSEEAALAVMNFQQAQKGY